MNWYCLPLTLAAIALSPLQSLAADPVLPVVRQLSYWSTAPWQGRPVVDRIQRHAATEMVEFLRQENASYGLTEIPKRATAPTEFLTDLRAALARLPGPILRLIAQSLTAITLVEDLGSTAFTELILDVDDTPAAGFIVLDVGRLDRNANAWATYKANTPFSTSEGLALTATIATAENDNRSHAIQYILLHEIAHVLAAVDGAIHPRWDRPLPDNRHLEKRFPFTALSWKSKDGVFIGRVDDVWPQRSQIHYYADPKDQIPIQKAPAIYAKYSVSNFSTLYGATNPYDDFAESFVNYVHTMLLSHPYKVTLHTGDTVTTYEACWRQPRCQSKRRLLESWLQSQGVSIP